MNLAFEHGYLRDNDDPAIKKLTVLYRPESVQDAFKYIREHVPSVSYFSINFDQNMDVLAVDYGSHTDFCYLWDLTPEQKRHFAGSNEQADKQISEQADKRRFADEVLYKIKQMTSIPYDVAVAFDKILGGEY